MENPNYVKRIYLLKKKREKKVLKKYNTSNHYIYLNDISFNFSDTDRILENN